MAHTIESLLGETVEGAGGEAVSVRSLCGKERIVGFYFTASWSPPCWLFTPTLTSFYKSLRDDSHPASASNEHLEIVQISWDKDENSFQEAAKAVPWLSLPFKDIDRQRKLCRKFNVHGIPRLVLLDGETGRVITRDGFDRLEEDNSGSGFPWRRKPLGEILPGTLLEPMDGSDTPKEVSVASVIQSHKILGFYFSAQWCVPCRYFDQDMSKAYTALRKQGHSFQVIMVSADRSEEAFQRHVAGVSWPYLRFDDPQCQAIKTHLSVDGIPMLVLVDSNTGSTITMNGRQSLMQDPECKEFPWYPKPVEDLMPWNSVVINERACVILFTEGSEEDMKQGRSILSSSAKKELDKADLRDLLFFVTGDDDVSDNVRDFADLDDTCPLLIILDSPEQKVYICAEEKLSPEAATKFVEDYFKGELTPTPIVPLAPTDDGLDQSQPPSSDTATL